MHRTLEQGGGAHDPAPAAAPVRVGVVFAGLMLVLLLAALDNTIVATALPTIVGELGGLQHISWITSSYLLAQTAVTPLYGKLGDLYGRKRILQSAIVLFLAGSALCGLAQSMTQLIAFRAIQGLGAGGLIVLIQAVVGDIVPPRERGRYQGLFGGVFGVASVAGPLLGGFIVQHVSWRWIFYVNLPVGVAALAVIGITLPAVHGRARPVIDYLGAGLLASGLSAVVLVTSLGGTTWEWGSAQSVGTAIFGVVALVAFSFVERRAVEPVLPPALWRERVFAVAGALSAIVGFALFGSITFLPLYFQTVDAATPDGIGPAAAADDGRRPRHVDRLGPADLPPRPLQGVPRRRHADRRDRALPALPARGGHERAPGGRLPARPRPRPRHDHAGARPRRAERGRLRRPGRGHLRRDADARHRRLGRHRRVRLHLHEPAVERALRRVVARRAAEHRGGRRAV